MDNDNNDHARRRFKEMPIDELKRRVDLAVAYLRDLRQGLVVANGMVLEHTDRALPVLDQAHAEVAFQQIMEMLPLINPLPPEERAKLKRPSPDEREAMERTLDAMVEMDPEEFDEGMKELGLEYRHEDLAELKEEGEKIHLLGLVQTEMQALIPALVEIRQTLGDRMKSIVAKALSRGAQGDADGEAN